MSVHRWCARSSGTVCPSPRLAPVIRATRSGGRGASSVELFAMPVQGRPRFILVLVYKVYKGVARAPRRFALSRVLFMASRGSFGGDGAGHRGREETDCWTTSQRAKG